MQNEDALILLNQKVSLNDQSEDCTTQALRIKAYALYGEFELYRKAHEAYKDEIYEAIAHEKAKEFEILKEISSQMDAPLPSNDVDFTLPMDEEQTNFLAISKEIKNIQLCEYLLSFTKEHEKFKDALYRSEAMSFNTIIPALKNKMQNDSNVLQKAQGFMETAQKIASNNATPEDFKKLASNANLSLLGGVFVGAIGSVMLEQFMQKNEENKTQNTTQNQGEEK